MQRWMCAVVGLVVACKGGGGTKAESVSSTTTGAASTRSASAGPLLRTMVPTVSAAHALATPKPTDEVPVLVLVGQDGKTAAVEGPRAWAALDAFTIAPGAAVTVDARTLGNYIGESVALNRSTRAIVNTLREVASSPVRLEPVDPDAADDPPPPDEYDAPDDGADEDGGTGTAMALDEGRMGSQRTEGQYRMQKPDAAELALPTTLRGLREVEPRSASSEAPSRVSAITGEVTSDGSLLVPAYAAIAAAPSAPARALVGTLVATKGTILVAHGSTVRPLRLQFQPVGRRVAEPAGKWIEVRVSSGAIAVEAVPDVPVTLRAAGELGAAFAAARAKPKFQDAAVDVLVTHDATAQALVDVLVALDAAGATTISLGRAPAPGSSQAGLRGRVMPRFELGPVQSQGALAKTDIGRALQEHRVALRACHDQVRATQPDVEGTVIVTFLIAPTGKVQSAMANGAHPALAQCLADGVKTIRFTATRDRRPTQVIQPVVVAPNY